MLPSLPFIPSSYHLHPILPSPPQAVELPSIRISSAIDSPALSLARSVLEAKGSLCLALNPALDTYHYKNNPATADYNNDSSTADGSTPKGRRSAAAEGSSQTAPPIHTLSSCETRTTSQQRREEMVVKAARDSTAAPPTAVEADAGAGSAAMRNCGQQGEADGATGVQADEGGVPKGWEAAPPLTPPRVVRVKSFSEGNGASGSGGGGAAGSVRGVKRRGWKEEGRLRQWLCESARLQDKAVAAVGGASSAGEASVTAGAAGAAMAAGAAGAAGSGTPRPSGLPAERGAALLEDACLFTGMEVQARGVQVREKGRKKRDGMIES